MTKSKLLGIFLDEIYVYLKEKKCKSRNSVHTILLKTFEPCVHNNINLQSECQTIAFLT